MRRVYDCLIFNDELDLLEARLKWLDEYVSYFVIVEATRTFSGRLKPLYYSQHRGRFAAWADKIRAVVVDDLPSNGADRWAAEVRQRDAVLEALTDARSDDVIIVSDVDEFVDRDVMASLRCGVTGVTGLELESTFFRANWMVPMGPFSCAARAFKAGQLSRPHFQRNFVTPDAIIRGAGVHFAYLLDTNEVRRKFANYAHSEMDDERETSPAFIARAQQMGLDVFSRRLVTVRQPDALSSTQRHLYALHRELFDFTRLPSLRERWLFRWYAEWRVNTDANVDVVRELDEQYDRERLRVVCRAVIGWLTSYLILGPRRVARVARRRFAVLRSDDARPIADE